MIAAVTAADILKLNSTLLTETVRENIKGIKVIINNVKNIKKAERLLVIIKISDNNVKIY